MKYVVWDVPSPDGTNIQEKITINEAINRAKAAAQKCDHIYDNDADALTDFLLIHWAWIVEENCNNEKVLLQ